MNTTMIDRIVAEIVALGRDLTLAQISVRASYIASTEASLEHERAIVAGLKASFGVWMEPTHTAAHALARAGELPDCYLDPEEEPSAGDLALEGVALALDAVGAPAASPTGEPLTLHGRVLAQHREQL